MIAEFSVIPIGTGASTSAEVAKVVKLIDESGLPYKLNPMGTVIEGEWAEVMGLIEKCHKIIYDDVERVTLAPWNLANSMPMRIAFCDRSEPSVGIRICLNIYPSCARA